MKTICLIFKTKEEADNLIDTAVNKNKNSATETQMTFVTKQADNLKAFIKKFLDDPEREGIKKNRGWNLFWDEYEKYLYEKKKKDKLCEMLQSPIASMDVDFHKIDNDFLHNANFEAEDERDKYRGVYVFNHIIFSICLMNPCDADKENNLDNLAMYNLIKSLPADNYMEIN